MEGGGVIAQEIWHHYTQPLTRPSQHHICELLDREGFFPTPTPIIDVAAGRSPHLGWNLLHRVAGERELYFTDWHADWLTFHKGLYQAITQVEHPASRL